MFIGEISTQSLVRAFKTFKQFKNNTETIQLKAGAIKAFEYTYERAWKVMKKILAQENIAVSFQKDVFREAARYGLIESPEIWFTFQEKRNLSAHAYNEEQINLIIEMFDDFYTAMISLLKKLGVPDDQY